MEYSDELLLSVLKGVKSVALVGVSTNPVRPSYYVGRYLDLKGYDVLPVNPVYKGQSLWGSKIRPSLKSLRKRADHVHMVDVFRRSEEAEGVVDDALKHLMDKGLKAIWMQIGVVNERAAEKAEAAGLTVIMNRCPKIEYQRLIGELSMGGFNSGRVSSKLRQA
ncbi:MAG: CoA-binding protein [Pseudomonadota bacterium]